MNPEHWYGMSLRIVTETKRIGYRCSFDRHELGQQATP